MKIELIFCHQSPRDETFSGLLRQKKKALMRGANAFAVPLHKSIVFPEAKPELLLELERLSSLDARLCRIVALRYFMGLTIAETAPVLNSSPAMSSMSGKQQKSSYTGN